MSELEKRIEELEKLANIEHERADHYRNKWQELNSTNEGLNSKNKALIINNALQSIRIKELFNKNCKLEKQIEELKIEVEQCRHIFQSLRDSTGLKNGDGISLVGHVKKLCVELAESRAKEVRWEKNEELSFEGSVKGKGTCGPCGHQDGSTTLAVFFSGHACHIPLPPTKTLDQEAQEAFLKKHPVPDMGFNETDEAFKHFKDGYKAGREK